MCDCSICNADKEIRPDTTLQHFLQNVPFQLAKFSIVHAKFEIFICKKPRGIISYWLGRFSTLSPAETEVMVFRLSHLWQHLKLSDVSLWACPRCSLVVDEDVQKPTNQTNFKPLIFLDLAVLHLSLCLSLHLFYVSLKQIIY